MFSYNVTLIITAVFLYIFLIQVNANGECVSATFKQTLRNEGFHRDIHYVVNLKKSDIWENGVCMLSIEQHLPAGAYVNSDELQDMRRHNKVHACAVGEVDVEKPKHISRPITVHMFAHINSSQVKITLPIHLRYHQAKPKGTFEKVIIGYPWIYLRCPNSFFKKCTSPSIVLSPCGACSPHKCSWHNITATPVNRKLEMLVPIGDTDDYSFVTTATFLVSYGGCFYMLLNLITAITVGGKTYWGSAKRDKKLKIT